jgi:TPR repeat protein
MFSSKVFAQTALKAGAMALATPSIILSSASTSCCEERSRDEKRIFKLLRKETTLRQAQDANKSHPVRRQNTRAELSKLRINEKEMLLRWELDEDGWRELPARAWPAYQPKLSELEGIKAKALENGCSSSSDNALCTQLLFNIATCLVFYNVNAERGFRQYEELAKRGHVDSMVACGIMLVEGLGVEPQEEKGIEWLKKATLLDSSQGCYELGTVLYTGIEGVIEEDPEGAFALFEKAAEQDHTAGLYMVADCLIEGEGTEKSVAKAVPIFYQAAERGHRFSRQRIRELLSRKEYKL